MPARINNLPAFSVLDVSNKITVTSAVQHGVKVITGTVNNIFDKDVSTSYVVLSDYDSTGNPVVAQITLDYGQVFWNCQLFTNYEMTESPTVEISDDALSWTTIGTTNGHVEQNFQVQHVRYVRFTNTRAANADTQATLYEVRLMGS